MKRLINIFSVIILLASCVQESIEPAQQITGLYALDNGTGLTKEYIKFDKGKLSDFISEESFPLAENHIWDDGEAAFKIRGIDRYSIKDGKYTTTSNIFSGASISKDGDDGLIFGSKSYVRLDGFKKEPYSSIHPEKYAYENPLQGGEYFFPVSVTNPIAAGSLTANSSSSWISGIVMTGGLLRYQLSSTKTHREGKITLKYTHAEDVQVTIHQIPATFIRLEETLKTIGYEGSSIEVPYTIENPLNGTTLTVSTTEGWIKDITVLENKVTFTTEENNSGDTRTANLTFSYEGAEDVQFSLIQNWSAVSIELMPDSEKFDYAGGYGSFTFEVHNPREGVVCTAESKVNWITNVSISRNRVSYKISENNSGAARTGYIQLKYGTFAIVEFAIKQEWAESEIVLTPSSETFDYNGGLGTLSFEVQNPREGVVCVVKNQESWIANVVKTSGNSASYSVKANNSAIARTGKILITYGSFATAELIVTQSGQPVTSLTLNKTSLSLLSGESETLVATVVPSDAELIWGSNNNSVASVVNGTVKANGNGTAIITVKSQDGNKSATCKVTVTTAVTGVSLNKTTLSLNVGQSETLVATVFPSSASNKSVNWTSTDTEVATVSSGGLVTTVKAGTAVVTATTVDGNFKAACTVTVKPRPPMTDLGKTFVPVDLGLSVKWASFNLGATTPEGYGNYYAWGETAPKSKYDWSTYKFGTSSSGPFSKYNTNSSYGTADNKTVLDPEDDAAAVALGGSWRMPTKAEHDELRNNCTWTWTTLNGVYGRKVTSKKEGYTDKWIFLPAAGDRGGSSLNTAGSSGYYWSSSLYTGNARNACSVFFQSGYVSWDYYYRCRGQSVRPVSE